MMLENQGVNCNLGGKVKIAWIVSLMVLLQITLYVRHLTPLLIRRTQLGK